MAEQDDVAASESVEAMMASLFQEEEDDDDEVRELQKEIQSLAAKANEYSCQGPALITNHLHSYLQLRRPTFSLDAIEDLEQPDTGYDECDPTVEQAKVLKAQIAALKKEIPALLQRMKNCLEACEKKQRISEERKPPLPGFLQEVHKVWEALSPYRPRGAHLS